MLKTNKIKDPDESNRNRTILDAFRRGTAGGLSMTERLEDEISLPNGQKATMDDLIVLAAMLGLYLSPEGQVTIGIHTSETPSVLELDTTKLREADDVRSCVLLLFHRKFLQIPYEIKSPPGGIALRRNAERASDEGMAVADIAVMEGRSSSYDEAPLWLYLQNGRCMLSVRGDSIESDMFAHLCKLTTFAGARACNVMNSPAADSLPPHMKYEPHQRRPIMERIHWHKEKRPSAAAIVDDTSGQTLSYAKLWEEATAVIRQVRQQEGIRQGYPRLALFMERGWQHLAAVIAIQRMGGTCVLIDVTHPDDRLHDFLAEAQPDAILTVGEMADRVHQLTDALVLELDNRFSSPPQTKPDEPAWSEANNDVCFIAGTSGSTGRPKAACLSYRGMAATVDTIIDAAALGEETRGSWLSSPGYGMIEVDPIPVLCAGGTVFIPAAEVLQDVSLLAQWYTRNKVNHTLVMTSIAEALWANGTQTSLCTMLIAGERCKQWPNTEYRVLNVYGSAEAAVVSIEELSGTRRTLLPTVGRAVPGANMYVVDGTGQELPACCVGELIITGETLSMGYLDDEQTQKSFHPNTLDASSKLQYSSGDRARMSLDGTVEIFGRTDALVKIRGHRVDLAEVEITALKVPEVAKAAAVCFNDSAGTILELFIEPVPDTKLDKDEVRRYLGQKLNPAAQPSQIHILKLPLGHNGKVDYTRLRARPVEAKTTDTAFYPATKTEIVLRDCWLSWTRCEEVSLASDFFQSGGDSLRAMRMIGELTHKHGIQIEMNSFYENPLFSNLIRLANSAQAAVLPQFEHLPEDQQLEPFVLNEYQQALWIGRGSDFHYGGVGCQGYFEWEARELNRERFVRAIAMLVERHPMLRITIDTAGNQRTGTVDGREAVEFQDLSMLTDNEREQEINRLREHMAKEKIETTKWPLFRFVVSRMNEQVSRIHFCIDLLIADAWSIFQVIIPDLIDLYLEEKPQLPKLLTTFQDYLAYRSRVRQSAQYHAHRDYWRQKIHDLPAAPKLPQLAQGESATARFDRHEGTLVKESWSRLKAQAQERKISPSGVVALLFCEVLRCWSEEERFTLNFPISDRMPVSDDIDFVVGDFTNILLVPYEADAGDNLKARGQKLQDAIWQALDYRLFTGVEVLRELSRLHRSGGKPLMPIVLTSLLGHPGRHDVSRLGREVYGGSQTPQVTLDVQVRESEGILYFKWDYLRGVIRPDVIADMFELFSKLLADLAEDPEIWECIEITERYRQRDERKEDRTKKLAHHLLSDIRRNTMNELVNKSKQTVLKQVVHAFSDRLDQSVVLLEDNFYDLGGDSLAAMKIKEVLESQLATTVSIESIMLSDTIGEFANDLAERVLQ